MTFEELLNAPEATGHNIVDYSFESNRIKGLYCDGTIALNEKISTTVEKSCILAEELGHHFTSSGDIINMDKIQNVKQEYKARVWGYNKKIGLYGIIKCYKYGCKNIYEMAQLLDVTEQYLINAIEYYRSKYGICTTIDNYIIYFEPCISALELI